MVVKTQLLLVIAFISGFLLTIQFLVLQIIVQRSQPDSDPIWRTLYAVTTTAYRSDVPVFLIDADILRMIQREFPAKKKSQVLSPGDGQNSYCQVLCRGQKITQLATLAEYVDEYKMHKFCADLREKGYTVLTFYESDDPGNKLHQPLLLHVIVLDEKLGPTEGHVIFISVLYDKVCLSKLFAVHILIPIPQLHSNWWRGQLLLEHEHERLMFRQGIRGTDLKFRSISTLFVKTEVKAAIMDGMVVNLPGLGVETFLGLESHLEFIPCNWTRARLFHEKYPETDFDREQNRLFRLKVKRILSSASQMLDKLRIPFWLSSGTLLGYYRSCDVIHYGRDVDIGIPIQHYKEELIDMFTMNDLMLMHSFGRVNDSFELSFRNEEIKLDIFFFYNESDHVWNGGTSTTTGFKYKYTFPHFSLCLTEFLGLKVRIPCHSTLKYIEANYGTEWFHPVREWDWKTSPPNVSPNGQWDMDDWPQVMQTFRLPQ